MNLAPDQMCFPFLFQDEGLENEEDYDEEDEETISAAAVPPPANRMLLEASSDEEGDKDMGEMKSNFEIRTGKLKKEIKKMEEQALSAKPWQMIGEVAAITRPENSLLQVN